MSGVCKDCGNVACVCGMDAGGVRVEREVRPRIEKLPLWAQKHIEKLEHEIERRDALVNVHALLSERNREWFTIRGSRDGHYRLFILRNDNPHAVCSIGPEDLLFIARGRA